MRHAYTVSLTLGFAAVIACSTRTPIGGPGDGGQTGGGPGTGGSGGFDPFVSGGFGFNTGGGFATGGAVTGGRGDFGFNTGGAPSTGGGGPPQTCPGGSGGTAGRPANAPTFLATASYRMLGYPIGVAIADLNGDAKSDLAVATYLPPATGGAGPPGPGGTGGVGTGGAGSIREGGAVAVLVNNGAGVFGAAKSYTVVAPSSLAAGDLSGDGKADIAMATSQTGTVAVLANDGSGTFAESVTYSVGVNPWSVAVGDLNGDGKLDLATANRGAANPGDVAVLLNTGGGAFVAANYLAGTNPTAIAIADLNGDGKGDLAVADSAGGASVLLNAGNGTFGAPAKYAAGTTPFFIAVGDVNGDGKPDIALTSGTNSGGIAVLINLGAGTFGAAVVYATESYPLGIAIGDLNADGFPDIATTYALPECNGASVLLNKGTGTFGAPIAYPLAGSPSSLALGDLSGDGKPDLAVVTDQGVSVLINAR